jgi:4-hydroxybenzoate polyprenyltransferase
MPSLRTLLILGRTSNLPTVWSNCLAAWWLGGGGDFRRVGPMLAGATLLYLGGMYLNDAFDVNFDSLYKRERPIPSGAISVKAVWGIGFALLAGGLTCLFFQGKVTGILGVVLALCILVYDAVHKLITVSPVLMAGCRFLLYLVAGSTGAEGVTGWVVWCGLAMGAYILGLSYLARQESVPGVLRYWPCFFLAVPIGLALIMNADGYLQNALWVSAVVALWTIRSLRYTYPFGGAEKNIGRTVSGLLAGIVWVDLLAVVNIPREFAPIFVVLFLLALMFQRYVPAT